MDKTADSTALSRYNHAVGMVCKNSLPIHIRKEQYELNKIYKLMENRIYQCIYDMLLINITEPAKLQAI